MTNAELNKAVKAFVKAIKAGETNPESKEAHDQFDRLYGTDKTLKAHNAESLRLMIWLNSKYQYRPSHRFGNHVEPGK
jgi:hypothetical protein